jgi:uncharacterized protein
MDTSERQVIDELFGKVRQAEQQSGGRDADAEACIRDHVARQPAAPYYMAQAIVVQEQALAGMQARVEDLERQLAERPAGGGFLGGLFGGGASARPAAPPVAPLVTPAVTPAGAADPRVARHIDPRQQRPGGGFLAGALQTALGVTGGVLLGNAIAGMFADPAAAAETSPHDDVPEDDHQRHQDDLPEDDFSFDDDF